MISQPFYLNSYLTQTYNIGKFTFFTDFQLSQCEDNALSTNQPTEAHQSEERHSEDENHKADKLKLELVKKTTVHKCFDKYFSRQPFTWMTTVKGETRDFYRVLNDVH